MPRAVELSPPGSRAPDRPSQTDDALSVVWPGRGCALGVQPALAKRLRGLAPPPDDLLSLELWGAKDSYSEGEGVPFYLRSPRRGYATLFWLGPKDDVFVVFNDLRLPGARDVAVDAGAIIVPPAGAETWVALLGLESAPFVCTTSGAAHRRWLDVVLGRAHAVGQWAITSLPRARPLP